MRVNRRKPVYDVAPGARLTIAPDAVVGDGCRFHVHAGEVVIGAGTRLGERCVIAAHERIEVGAGCVLGDGVMLMDFQPVDRDSERPIREQGLQTAPIRIGDGAILDHGACVLPGATVAAGERVTSNAVRAR